MLSSPNALATLVGLQDRLARLIGHLDFADVADPTRISQINDAIDEATDTLYQDAEWKLAHAEGRIKTFASLSGADGNVVNGSTLITDFIHAGFLGVLPGDKIHITPYEGSARITQAGIPNVNSLNISSPYPGPTLSGLAWEIVRDEYDMAADAWFITRVWDATNGNPLKMISEDQLQEFTGEKFESLVQSAAEPRLAMITRWNAAASGVADAKQGVKIRIYPAPKNEELEIGYSYIQVPTWQAGALAVGVQLASTLLYNKAATILLFDLDDPQRAMNYERKYQTNLGQSKRREVNRSRNRVIMRPQFTPGASAEPFQIGQDPKIIQGN